MRFASEVKGLIDFENLAICRTIPRMRTAKLTDDFFLIIIMRQPVLDISRLAVDDADLDDSNKW